MASSDSQVVFAERRAEASRGEVAHVHPLAHVHPHPGGPGMPRGVHDRFLQDVTDVVSEGPGRGVGELEARLDPDVPHTFEPLHKLSA